MSKEKHGKGSRISEHERAIRGYKEYIAWRELAEWLDKNPPVPVILRNILVGLDEPGAKAFVRTRPTYSDSRSSQALELLIKDRYTTFAVLERMKGGEKK